MFCRFSAHCSKKKMYALKYAFINHIPSISLIKTQVLIVSRPTHLLTPCCEALLSLLFPLKFAGIYIPNLPVTLIQMFDTPVPFLIGMHVNNKSHINKFVNPGQTYTANYVEVNLDTNTCTFTKETGLLIPTPLIVRDVR